MRALADYLREVIRQADLLDFASELDSHLLVESRPDQDFAHRRHWTRQDGNRAVIADFTESLTAVEDNLCPQDLEAALGQLFELQDRRDRTRIGFLVGRFRSAGRNIDRYHAEALRQAANIGAYSILAPLLVTTTRRHKLLIRSYAKGRDDHSASRTQLEAHDVAKRLWDRAIRELRQYVPEASTSSGLVRQAMAGAQAHQAHRENLFPLGPLADDPELQEAIELLFMERTESNKDIDLLRKRWPDGDTAHKLPGRIRKARLAGKTTLPPRTTVAGARAPSAPSV